MQTRSFGRFELTSVPEILKSLNQENVRYLVIGGYASVIHGVPRTTLDLDLALDPEERSVEKALRALTRLGLQPDTTRVDEILGQGGVTATNDREVDLLTSLPGTTFDEAWTRRLEVRLRGMQIAVVSKTDQIRLLKAAGRPRDLEDAEVLEGLESEG